MVKDDPPGQSSAKHVPQGWLDPLTSANLMVSYPPATSNVKPLGWSSQDWILDGSAQVALQQVRARALGLQRLVSFGVRKSVGSAPDLTRNAGHAWKLHETPDLHEYFCE